MLWVHALLQATAISAVLYTFYLGWIRIQSLYLGAKRVFPWKTHVRLGRWAMALLFMGGLGGFTLTYALWGALGVSGTHALVGTGIMGLLLLGYGSGYMLDARKGSSVLLRAAHGMTNSLLVCLALWQVVTGLNLLL